MTAKIPYILSVGLIPKILEKIQNARRPDRFTQDFLETKLGHSGGSARAMIPLLKRMGLLGSDGVPTTLYDRFRNTETQGAAIAEGMRNAFSELFDRNEYVYELSKDKLTGQVVEITGAAKEERTTAAIVGTFMALNEIADFEADTNADDSATIEEPKEPIKPTPTPSSNLSQISLPTNQGVDLRVGYTINLNLPETSDPEVFNAIFKALRENLLRD